MQNRRFQRPGLPLGELHQRWRMKPFGKDHPFPELDVDIENATYVLTVCAERVAIWKAMSEGHREFKRIVVVADTEAPTPPCGACRQILWEFGGDLEVVLAGLREIKGVYSLSKLLPHPFDARLLS